MNRTIDENSIRPDDIFEKFLELCIEDAENFFNKENFIEIPCPACGSDEKDSWFKKHSFQYVECANCRSLFVSPRPSLEDLGNYYSSSASAAYWADNVIKKTLSSRRKSIVRPNVERISELTFEKANQDHTIIDIGAGSGSFLSEWKNEHPKASLIAIEPGDQAAKECEKLNIQVKKGVVENTYKGIGPKGDIVTCFEVIEHVQNPKAFATAVFGLVAPEGTAIITGLGVDGFDIQIMWENSRSIMPPHHLNFMSAEGIKELFLNAGFSKVTVVTPGRLDVEIVSRAIARKSYTPQSRFERFLFSRNPATLDAFQQFLAENKMSSHVWAICQR
ncbi:MULTISPECIES: class I SAM-dependent methyltransferase [Thalassospira]|jgi:ribosomal protein S27E|uniref:class I SAM-dependent methyltransferase n=1 Tax=Thalassospira TaxID=168934 RepID=UPI0007A5E27C|nr:MULTISPECIES: class I SAM-dependent methyltransferase [unclassified Thalassospira]KZC99074.1 hypothetical protein AUQ41_11135 [Thalassospira sp. MCCC 1A02898]ONH89354.1 hypothetical protein TH47_01460 [Thalassospira sp. MCCC 1A02803]BDW90336.1 SAM-dependent methyltransferase [Thalassospira tepidiphila]